jgi:hypothetical protein
LLTRAASSCLPAPACRLESMAGLSMCTALVELYLSHNGIWALDSGLTRLTGLKVGHGSTGVTVTLKVLQSWRLK